MADLGQGKNDRFAQAYTDSFGFLRTALSGVTTWTDAQLRTTGVVLPTIAKNDVLSYNVQFPHNKSIGSNIADFHLHIIPLAAAAGDVTFTYHWGWFSFGDTIPDVLPNTSTATITLAAADQYKHLYFDIVENMAHPATETYSSFFLIKLQRANDASDTYTGNIAILGADCHYKADRVGSYNVATD